MPATSSLQVEQPPTTAVPDIDIWTVACIAVVAYLFASVIHEGLGHGLTAILLGARDVHVSTAAMWDDPTSLSEGAARLVNLAGPVVGLLVGCVLAIVHARTRGRNAEGRYCLWLTAYVCLFANSGYLMALSFVHFADIHAFIQGLPHSFLGRLGFTILGTAIYVGTMFFAARTVNEFLGLANRRRRAAKLLVTSYVVGSLATILSTLLGHEGVFLTLISAGPATLGGTIGLPYTIFFIRDARPSTPPVPLTPRRSVLWTALGGIAVLIHVLFLGPGVPP